MKIEILKFGASWCGPCVELNEGLKRHPLNIPGVELKEIDVDDNERMADAFAIETVPTVVVMRDGNELWRNEGFMTPEDLESKIKTVIANEA